MMSEADSTPLFFEPWIQFKTPIVRQLAFCISSPNILSQKPHELVIKTILSYTMTIIGKSFTNPTKHVYFS
jgi:hypothetical protein